MKGFIEVTYTSEKKRISIAIGAIVAVRDTPKGAYITLAETSLGGESVELHVNHTYDEVLARIQEAS